MKITAQNQQTDDLIEAWELPYAATLGSSVRSKGIFLEVRAQLPVAFRNSLTVKSRVLSLQMADERLKDGRLPSAGTRTVTLRGRARRITFHIFDPHVVEDILDRNLVDHWREEDAERRAENRRLAAAKSTMTRSKKVAGPPADRSDGDDEHFKLRGWADFKRESGL